MESLTPVYVPVESIPATTSEPEPLAERPQPVSPIAWTVARLFAWTMLVVALLLLGGMIALVAVDQMWCYVPPPPPPLCSGASCVHVVRMSKREQTEPIVPLPAYCPGVSSLTQRWVLVIAALGICGLALSGCILVCCLWCARHRDEDAKDEEEMLTISVSVSTHK